MKNCGRCGKQIHNPSDAICAGCKKVLVAGHGKHVDKENRKQELYENMIDSMKNPGKDDDDNKYDVDFWGLGDEDRKYQKRGKKR